MFRRIVVSASLPLLILSAAYASEAGRVVLVESEVYVNGHPAVVDGIINEGDRLQTGAKGYLYIKTIDNGFFILRPRSTGRIARYRIDKHQPENTRIKLEVDEGVARHISGEAVKDARHNFRLNTPVAAIGVRGTDFTVFTSRDTSRVSVVSGGVVVSPFSGSCDAGGHGPCEGTFSRELFATQVGQLLQVNRGQSSAEFLRADKQAPDSISPPRRDEPSASGISGKDSVKGGLELDLFPAKSSSLDQFATVSTGGARVQPPENPLIWGRWEVVLGQGKEIDVAALLQTHQLIATNGGYALLRSREGTWQRPEQNTMSFGLQGAQASILDEQTRLVSSAGVENANLRLDFAKATFTTQLDLVNSNSNERFKLQAQGSVTADGRLAGDSQFLRPTNMAVQGILNNDNASAAYLFQSRLDEQRVANGVTYWGR